MTNEIAQTLRTRLLLSERLTTALTAVGIASVFGVALWLDPDPRGFGTHQQLGLPGCMFRSVTGLHCPHCGMTTSFCWFVRGNLRQSCRANPSGLLLAVASVLLLPWFVAVTLKGDWFGIRDPGRIFTTGFGIWLLLSVVLWLFRIA